MQNMVVYKRVCLVYSRFFRLFIYLFLTYSRKSAKLIVNEGEYAVRGVLLLNDLVFIYALRRDCDMESFSFLYTCS